MARRGSRCYAPGVDVLCHPREEYGRRRLERFMVIGGTFRDVAVRPASTRDIDVVLIDRKEIG